MNTIFTRTETAIGKDNLNKLKKSRIIIFGVGGVGSFSAESLARVGIGEITIVDFDTIDITNVNRQIEATTLNIGKNKVDEMAYRMSIINPELKINILKEKVSTKNISSFNIKNYDYVIDAIDDVPAKIAIIKHAYENRVKIISSMGAGRKIDPTRFKVADISKTNTCPLAKTIRLNLRKIGINKGVKTVFSDEIPKNRSSQLIGSLSFVPSVVGLIISSVVVRELIDF
ncbi:tRNA threonylcarbamoyladenosine dehydratase [Haliovirga abyssi]|uniref:tRNA threonylcarbamoyladenosine dehydratase n=1 Tax=Haliovirga abyssi TaxID=2996794 RepID=A0AAU9D8I0_9FUSO|nr:tRNA threonylcarbamoyladenosine dehydratase [Haliovirga abyssi]BDU49555.1 tRNA threonylcarbamoyladenosine dehydratase [Haliovirga abyssi]